MHTYTHTHISIRLNKINFGWINDCMIYGQELQIHNHCGGNIRCGIKNYTFIDTENDFIFLIRMKGNKFI